MLMMALGRQGRHDECRVHAQAALAVARASGDAYTDASVLNNLSAGYIAERRTPQAPDSAEQALGIYKRINSKYGAAIAMLILSFTAQRCGRLSDARDQLLQLLTLCDAIGHRQIGAQARCNLARLLLELGPPEAALSHALDGIPMAQQDGDRFVQATGDYAAFQAVALLGQWPQAVVHGRRASSALAAHTELADALACDAGVAWALHQGGDSAAALQAVDAVLATVASRAGWRDDEADAAIHCHRLLARLRDPRAYDLLAAAHRSLMALASDFVDPAERDQHLQSTAHGREIQALWAEQSRPL